MLRRCIRCGRTEAFHTLYREHSYWLCEDCFFDEHAPQAVKCEVCGMTSMSLPIFYDHINEQFICAECKLGRCETTG